MDVKEMHARVDALLAEESATSRLTTTRALALAAAVGASGKLMGCRAPVAVYATLADTPAATTDAARRDTTDAAQRNATDAAQRDAAESSARAPDGGQRDMNYIAPSPQPLFQPVPPYSVPHDPRPDPLPTPSKPTK